MKATILSLFFFLQGFSQSPQYQITFNVKQVAKNIALTTNFKSYLIGDGETSLYEEDYINASYTSQDDNSTQMNTVKNPIFYKNLSQKTIIYSDHLMLKFFDIKDSLPDLNWKISSETKNILGYTCQKASLKFREKEFEVFFTSEIPFQDGPWKLLGLPGIILEMVNDDYIAKFQIIAEKIEIGKAVKKIENPYIGKNIISIEEYKKMYKKKYEEFWSRPGMSGSTIGMSKGFREIWVTD